jgi:hypothetical protein
MKGMIIDFDNRIGKLMNLCAHTLSSFGEYAADDVGYAGSEASSSFITHSNFSSSLPNTRSTQPATDEERSHHDSSMIEDKTGALEELNLLFGHENKVRWLERKVLVKEETITTLFLAP